MADHGSYVITMYKASKLHGERYRKKEEVKRLRDTKEREKEKKHEKGNLILTTRSTLS